MTALLKEVETSMRTKHPLLELLDQIIEEWGDRSEFTTYEVAAEAVSRMDAGDRAEALAYILPGFIGNRISNQNSRHDVNAVPDTILEKQNNIKVPGKAWSHQRAFSTLRFAAGSNRYVLWPEVTYDLIVTALNRLEVKHATTVKNIEWYSAVRKAMEKHGAVQIKDLPESTRTRLEKMKGADLTT